MVRSVPQPAPSLRSGVAAGERCLCGALAGFGCRPPSGRGALTARPGGRRELRLRWFAVVNSEFRSGLFTARVGSLVPFRC